MIGQTIAHYKVTAKLGAGGMGEVYRATDTKLNRDVALKVLPQAFASDEQRMVRFEREAQVLASLNHAHIATIHGLEESGATRALVMELVEGPTLAERIARGAIPLEEAVAIATQIAEGLEYAHEHNVIHRDLKPANIKLTNDGQVKILDFGLAKALEGETSAQDLSTSPTISMAATRAGIILGTAAYMSPEQARGTPVDKRCDIWSFGVVLFEMLTGKQIFSGETASDTLAAVLRADLEWSSLPVATPPAIRQLLERCLKRDRKQRLRDIGDARMQLEEAMSGAGSAASGVTPGVVSPVRTQIPWLAIGATAAVTLALSWIAFRAIAPTPVNLQATPVRLALRVPSDWSVEYEDHSAVAITNDGRKVAYSARKKGGERMLHLRSLDKLEDTVLAGTEDALDPFFSPDGLWIGFFANGRLKKISATGGLPIQLMEGTDDRGATWAEDDFIYYSPAPNSSVFRIPAAGGPPTPVTKLANDSGEQSHRWAQLLPGGKTILYTVKTTSLPTFDEAKIVVETLATHERQTVLEGGSHSVYVPSGHILFTRAGTLYAVPFDVGSLKVRGAPTKIVDGVATDGGTGASSYAVSGTGTLVNVSGGSSLQEYSLVLVDRKGAIQALPFQGKQFFNPRLSPDGRGIAVGVSAANDQIWVGDLSRGTMVRLTFEPQNSDAPVWTPDGKRIIYSQDDGKSMNIYWRPADGSGQPERLTNSPNRQTAVSVSRDGRWMAFVEQDPKTGNDIWVMPLSGGGKPVPFVRTPFNEVHPGFSPDGRWMVYASNETGRMEVYAAPFPGPGGRIPISNDGGEMPKWSNDEKEIIYFRTGRFYRVPVKLQPKLEVGKAEFLFEAPWFSAYTSFQMVLNYDLMPDGRHLLMSKSQSQAGTIQELQIVLNWFEELKRMAPAGGNAAK